MNKGKLTFLVILVLMFARASAQEKNKDVMVKKVFSVLKNKDENGFINLFPDAATTKNFLTKLMGRDSAVSEHKEMLSSFLAEINDSILKEDYKADYKDVMLKFTQKGIDPSRAVFVSYTADSLLSDEDDIKAVTLSGKIYFTVDSKDYFIGYDEIIWFEDMGWYGVSIRRVDEKGKEDEEEPDVESEMTVTDTTTFTPPVLVDTAMKAPIKKPVKTTTPAKPGNKPVKTKNATAMARKPE